MEILGVSLVLLVLFVGFGLLIGTLFGFFGMGGSFLVTPALLVLGYPAEVAVGSGLAFVFGTSVIAAIKHRDHGQIDFKLGGMFIVGMTAGIEVGNRFVLLLKDLGIADLVVSVAYVLLLAGVGLFMFYDSWSGDAGDASGRGLVETLEQLHLPPMVAIKGGAKVSLWLTLALAFGIGILSGFLGVGGGFLLMPSMMYVLGVPAAVAVGTDVFQITVSGAYGAFVYAGQGSVDLSIVVPLLGGSALGARIGAAATTIVDEDDITGYFAAMLVLGALAVAIRQVGEWQGIELLNTVSLVIILGAALLVSGAIVLSSVQALREEGDRPTAHAD